MFKFLVLFVIISYAGATPGYPLVGYGYGVPAATSYSSRVDYHTPVVAKTVVAAAPVVPSYSLGYGGHYGGLSYPYAKTVVSAPVVPAYNLGFNGHYGGLGYPYSKTVVSAPAVSAYGLGYAGHYGGLGYSHGSGFYNGNGLGYGNIGYGYNQL